MYLISSRIGCAVNPGCRHAHGSRGKDRNQGAQTVTHRERPAARAPQYRLNSSDSFTRARLRFVFHLQRRRAVTVHVTSPWTWGFPAPSLARGQKAFLVLVTVMLTCADIVYPLTA